MNTSVTGIKSDDFRKNNNILFKRNIVANETECCNGRFIDMNNNGIADFEEKDSFVSSYGFLTKERNFSEPFLSIPWDFQSDECILGISEDVEHSEIITKEIVEYTAQPEISVKNLKEVSSLLPSNNELLGKNYRSLSEFVKELLPNNPQAKWAIDVVNSEFLVYEPKEGYKPPVTKTDIEPYYDIWADK